MPAGQMKESVFPTYQQSRSEYQLKSAHNLAFCLLVAGIVAELTVSANLLTWIGDPYVSEGGSIVTKLHPGTYLITAAFAVELFTARDPIQLAWNLALKDRGALCFLVGLCLCVAFAFLLTGAGSIIVLIDTFFPAGMIALLASDFGPKNRRVLRICVELCFALNAVVALAEGVSQGHLIPLYLNGEAYQSIAAEFRPTALYDHPLTGSALTMIGILLPQGNPEKSRFRSPYILLLCTSLFAFGGRTAFVLTCLASSAKFVQSLVASVLARERRSASQLTSMVLLVLSVPVALLVASATGLGTRLIGHLYWDASANVRVSQWQILDMLGSHQILFGCRRDDLLALLHPLYLSTGVEVVENFWLLEFISLGLIAFPVFAVALFSLLGSSIHRAGPGSIYLVASFLIAASSSNSLGRKSNLLIVLVAAMSTLPAFSARPARRFRDR